MRIISLFCFVAFATFANSQSYLNCITPDNTKGLCKPIKQCDTAIKLLQSKPLTDQNKEYLRKMKCKEDVQPWVCCPMPVRKSGILPKAPACGIETEDRIVGGEETKINEFPWIALLGYDKSSGKRGYHCGGSLINDRYVLTAAHCVQQIPQDYKLSHVKLGEWDTTTDIDCDDSYVNERVCNDPHLLVNISEIVVHSNYQGNSKNQHNDIALLRLASKVNYTEFIRTICLPTEPTTKNKNLTNISLTVSGFGKTEKGKASTKKLKVNVDGVSNAKCNSVYNKGGLQIIDSQFCAGGAPGKDSCNGDSGGPLMAATTTPSVTVGHYVMFGIVSYGPRNCGTREQPGVYTKVSHYIDWIKDNIYE